MNRRDFAKGLALPLAGAATSFASICGTTCTPNPKSLSVRLQGPFAVVLNRADWSIKAFTPRHNSEHLFSFNGTPSDKDKKYGFLLGKDGLHSAAGAPCIENPFQLFCAENIEHQQSQTEHFITIDLPAPQKILVLSSYFTAIMEDGSCAAIPGDHILQYDVTDKSKILMYGSEGGDLVQLKPQEVVTDKLSFMFEVGLPKLLGGGSSDPDGTRASDFYNTSLLPYFPSLAGVQARRLKQITACTPAVPASRTATPKIRNSNKVMTASTLEFKAGGLIVTSP